MQSIKKQHYGWVCMAITRVLSFRVPGNVLFALFLPWALFNHTDFYALNSGNSSKHIKVVGECQDDWYVFSELSQ